MKTMKTLLFALVATLAVRAPAEYLLWSVDWSQVDPSADYAVVAVLNSDGTAVKNEGEQVFLMLADGSGADAVGKGEETVLTGIKSVIESPYNSDPYKFAIQVYDSGDNLLGSTDPVTYSQLPGLWGSDGQSIPSGGTTFSTVTSNYHAVPEPATGMLFVAGALMLFRRKRNA